MKAYLLVCLAVVALAGCAVRASIGAPGRHFHGRSGYADHGCDRPGGYRHSGDRY